MTTYNAHYINGQWHPSSGAPLPVHDSSTEEVFATVPAGTAAEAAEAVLAARAAFAAWSTLPVEKRADRGRGKAVCQHVHRVDAREGGALRVEIAGERQEEHREAVPDAAADQVHHRAHREHAERGACRG